MSDQFEAPREPHVCKNRIQRIVEAFNSIPLKQRRGWPSNACEQLERILRHDPTTCDVVFTCKQLSVMFYNLFDTSIRSSAGITAPPDTCGLAPPPVRGPSPFLEPVPLKKRAVLPIDAVRVAAGPGASARRSVGCAADARPVKLLHKHPLKRQDKVFWEAEPPALQMPEVVDLTDQSPPPSRESTPEPQDERMLQATRRREFVKVLELKEEAEDKLNELAEIAASAQPVACAVQSTQDAPLPKTWLPRVPKFAVPVTPQKCVVCNLQLARHAARPCNHLLFCDSCRNECMERAFPVCLVCNSPITVLFRVSR